jgi:plasmid stabilization system protein ParE
MVFKVILTPQSQEDLRAAVAFIARHDPQRAKTFGIGVTWRGCGLSVDNSMSR